MSPRRSTRSGLAPVVGVLAGLLALCASAPVRASEEASPPLPREEGAPHRLHAPETQLAFESLGNLSLLLVANGISVDESACSWCAPNDFDISVRDAFVVSDTETAALWSDILLYGVGPAAGLAAVTLPALVDGPPRVGEAIENGVIVLNAVMLTLTLTQITKISVGRERPGSHFGTVDLAADDRYRSFFSGHTSMTTSIAASAATVAFLRDYDAAPWIAAGGGALAVSVGMLRIAADRHWSSDVLVGFAVGAAVGIGFPLLLHPRLDDDPDPEAASTRLQLHIVPPSAERPAAILLSGAW